MTYEQKLAALQCLAPAHLEMVEPGRWYVSWRANRKRPGDPMIGGMGRHATTPEQAVEAIWRPATEDGYIVVTDALRETRRHYRWNGFMWKEVEDKAP